MGTKTPSILAVIITDLSLLACIVAAITLSSCSGTGQPTNNSSVLPGVGAVNQLPTGSGDIVDIGDGTDVTTVTITPDGEEDPQGGKDPNIAIDPNDAQNCSWGSDSCHVIYLHVMFQGNIFPHEGRRARDNVSTKVAEDLTTIVGFANPSSRLKNLFVFRSDTARKWYQNPDSIDLSGNQSVALLGHGQKIHSDISRKRIIPDLMELFDESIDSQDKMENKEPRFLSRWIPVSYRGNVAPIISSIATTRIGRVDTIPDSIKKKSPEISLSEQSTVHYTDHDSITHGIVAEVFHNWKFDDSTLDDNETYSKKRWTHLSIFNPGDKAVKVLLTERIRAETYWLKVNENIPKQLDLPKEIYREVTIDPGHSWDSAGAQTGLGLAAPNHDSVCKISVEKNNLSSRSAADNRNCWWNFDGLEDDNKSEDRNIGLFSTLEIDANSPVIITSRTEVRSTHGTTQIEKLNNKSNTVSPTVRRKETLNGVIDEINEELIREPPAPGAQTDYKLYGPAFFNGVSTSGIHKGYEDHLYSLLTLHNNTDHEIKNITIIFHSNDGRKSHSMTVETKRPGQSAEDPAINGIAANQYWNSINCNLSTGQLVNFPSKSANGFNEGWFEIISPAPLSATLTTRLKRVPIIDGSATGGCTAEKVESASEVLSANTYSEATSFRFAKNIPTGPSRNTGIQGQPISVSDHHWTYLEVVNTGSDDATVTVNQHLIIDGKTKTRSVDISIPKEGRFDTRKSTFISNWFDGDYMNTINGEETDSPIWDGMYTVAEKVAEGDTPKGKLIFSERQEYRNDLVDSFEGKDDTVTEFMVFPNPNESSLRVLDRYTLPGKKAK